MKLMVPFACACWVALAVAPAWGANELCLSATSHGPCASPLTQPLFDPALLWIPGDREEGSFYVRNNSSDRALLDIAVLGFEADAAKLVQTGELQVEVRAGNGPWRHTNLTGRHELVSSVPVAAGQEMKVSVAATFPYGSTPQNQSQIRHLDLEFEARLRQDVAAGGGGDNDDSDDHDGGDHDGHDKDGRDHNGALPGTGGPVWWLLPAGLLGVATGWLTVTLSERREERADV